MGCFVYCFLGSAKDITLGPTAIMSLLTAEFAKSPIHGDATIAVVLTFFCGIIQLLMGMFKLGKQKRIHLNCLMFSLYRVIMKSYDSIYIFLYLPKNLIDTFYESHLILGDPC